MISGESIFSTNVSQFQAFKVSKWNRGAQALAKGLIVCPIKPRLIWWRDPIVNFWFGKKAKALSVQVYRATEQFPRTETYGLTSQIRRSAVSVASNIAEGQGRL